MFPTPDSQAESLPRRPWWKRTRFGMRGALLAIAALGILIGWYTNRVREQRRVVAELERRGARLIYDYQMNLDRGISSAGGSPYPGWALDFLGIDFFHSVTSIRIEDPTFDDDDLVRVCGVLDRIQTVGVAFSAVTDEGMKFLRDYKSMRGLFLDGSANITDRGIDTLDLEHRPEVTVLCVRGTQVTGARVAKLRATHDAAFQRLKAAAPTGSRKIYPPMVLDDGPARRLNSGNR